jgi:hypothetical protein
VGEAAAEAKRQVELTRVALESDIDRIVAKARHELDWRARLRRDGLRIVLVAGVVVVIVGSSLALRGARGRPENGRTKRDPDIDSHDLAKQIKALRREVAELKDGDNAQPTWMKFAIRAATTAAAAAGTAAARQMLERSPATGAEGAYPIPAAGSEAKQGH